MRFVTCSLALALLTAACVAPEDDETATTSELTAAPRASAFVLTVRPFESPIVVTKPDGTVDRCVNASCQFAYLAGTTVTVRPMPAQNMPDCLKFDHWVGACAGQAATCTLTINSDLSTSDAWSAIRGCIPR